MRLSHLMSPIKIVVSGGLTDFDQSGLRGILWYVGTYTAIEYCFIFDIDSTFSLQPWQSIKISIYQIFRILQSTSSFKLGSMDLW